jgi:hypothetical protein
MEIYRKPAAVMGMSGGIQIVVLEKHYWQELTQYVCKTWECLTELLNGSETSETDVLRVMTV